MCHGNQLKVETSGQPDLYVNSYYFREDPEDYFPPKPPHSLLMLLVITKFQILLVKALGI